MCVCGGGVCNNYAQSTAKTLGVAVCVCVSVGGGGYAIIMHNLQQKPWGSGVCVGGGGGGCMQ